MRSNTLDEVKAGAYNGDGKWLTWLLPQSELQEQVEHVDLGSESSSSSSSDSRTALTSGVGFLIERRECFDFYKFSKVMEDP
ncbi:unnamed protein product [Bursaphelenchus xylophilus]|uniref:(pine wood nematode) hypothetical protein n=1 Tax=Bursaphelenchus xylophilus TaxID=6326 RepID=A0A811KNJ3_BURXY|nr:unnamed protein product [Bursaphelenchus xylophilus]CAG9099572.1 unnamed protein product [Bursaphelenchus xylophilus]